jgi:hypothetical protein
VASVLIEKPASGDFLSLIDGGYGLHYSALLEYREGRGMVDFCQMDVTGRTETEPAAEALMRGVLLRAGAWKSEERRKAVYVGEPAGRRHLEATGVAVRDYAGGKLSPGEVLIMGPGGTRNLNGEAANVAEWLKGGGHLLAIGLDQTEAEAVLPFKVTMKKAEHIATTFDSPKADSLLAGIGPAEVYNRDPRELPLIASGAEILGDGVLAQAEKFKVVFCQMVPWQFDGNGPLNLKRTHRRASFLVSRLLGNMGVGGATPILERFHRAVNPAEPESRWLKGLYLDRPVEWDDPYRFFRW